MTQIVVLDGQTVNPGDNDWGPSPSWVSYSFMSGPSRIS